MNNLTAAEDEDDLFEAIKNHSSEDTYNSKEKNQDGPKEKGD